MPWRGGGGGQCLTQKFSDPRSDEENICGLLGGPGACSPENFENKGSEIG